MRSDVRFLKAGANTKGPSQMAKKEPRKFTVTLQITEINQGAVDPDSFSKQEWQDGIDTMGLEAKVDNVSVVERPAAPAKKG